MEMADGQEVFEEGRETGQISWYPAACYSVEPANPLGWSGAEWRQVASVGSHAVNRRISKSQAARVNLRGLVQGARRQ